MSLLLWEGDKLSDMGCHTSHRQPPGSSSDLGSFTVWQTEGRTVRGQGDLIEHGDLLQNYVCE